MLASSYDTDVSLRDIYSLTRFYEGSYSRFIGELNRYETWEEAVKRAMNMHRFKYTEKLTTLN